MLSNLTSMQIEKQIFMYIKLFYILSKKFKVLMSFGHKSQLILKVDKGTVSLSGSTVHVVIAAEPVIFRAASSGAGGSITWLLKLDAGSL